jgi:hypothetical protein
LRSGSKAAALRSSLFHSHSLPVLQHAGVQPFLDEPHHAPVRNPVLEELHQPAVVDGIKGMVDTLPITTIISTATTRSGLRLFDAVIRSKGARSSCWVGMIEVAVSNCCSCFPTVAAL